jgi:hypothetical protein
MAYEKLQGEDLAKFKAKFDIENERQGNNGVFNFTDSKGVTRKYNTRLAGDNSGNDNDVLKSRANDNDYLKKQSNRYSKDSTDRVAKANSVQTLPVTVKAKKPVINDDDEMSSQKRQLFSKKSKEEQQDIGKTNMKKIKENGPVMKKYAMGGSPYDIILKNIQDGKNRM